MLRIRVVGSAVRSLLSGSRPKGVGLVNGMRVPLINTPRSWLVTKTGPVDKIDIKAEAAVGKHALASHPEDVSLESSVRHVFEERPGEVKDVDMLAGIKADLGTIKETFALKHVPRDALTLGAAGLLPYLSTSLSTVYLAYDINHAAATGEGFLFHPDTAREILNYLEPIQIGYGAVIISFLGAIHWGLEYAEYGGRHSYRRYAIGVFAPAVAWPTMIMPVEYALISQFLAFNALYFVDTRAAVRGWAPTWYPTHRFVLTFIVGASIVVSLVGRGQIADKQHHSLPGPTDKMKAMRDAQWENLEREERERRRAMVAADEAEEEEEEDDANDGGAAGEDGEEQESEDVESVKKRAGKSSNDK